jgi:hypothetical protein
MSFGIQQHLVRWRSNRGLYASCFVLVSCVAYSSTPKIEVICCSETSVDFYQITRYYIPEDSTLFSQRCENLKYNTVNNTYS